MTLSGGAGLLWAEHSRSRGAVWVTKPTASSGFLLVALGAGAAASTYGRLVLLALALGWLGDVLLIPRTRRTFLAGLVAFLLGHLAFALAFVARGVAVPVLAFAMLALLSVAYPVWRWLAPHVDRPMRAAVLAYIVVITTMVAAAGATTIRDPAPAITVGAIGFYLSDLAVARDRFVAPGLANKLWGIPLYFGAQLLLAWSTAGA